MKAVVLDGYTLNPGDLSWEGVSSQVEEFTLYDGTPQELAAQRIGDCEIVFTNKVEITREVMEACPSMKMVGLLATGYNIVDIAEAARRGIFVCNVPSYSTPSVAQMTFALLLEIANGVGLHDESVKAGEWTGCKTFSYWKKPQVELCGKTFGVVGFGSTGRAAAAIARAFGMEVRIYTRTRRPELLGEGMAFCTLDELLRTSDVLSLHCPLTDETQGLIGADALRRMKEGAILLNTARGALCDEGAVADALRAGWLAGAGFDVASVEPIAADNPLLTAPNCFITPHIAWATKAARSRLMEVLGQNLRAFLAGKPQNMVNGL